MSVIICLIAVTLLYSISSFATYTKEIRDSNYMLAISWFVALSSSTVWVTMARLLNDVNKIVAASLAWDLIVTAVYALIPALIQGKNLSWQAYAALALAVLALLWFKLSVE